MTAEELERATRQYDREMLDVPTVPIPPAVKARHDRIMAGRGRGRPKVGKGARRVLITVERDLLKDADKVAKLRGLSRSQLIAMGLRSILVGYRGSRAQALRRGVKGAK